MTGYAAFRDGGFFSKINSYLFRLYSGFKAASLGMLASSLEEGRRLYLIAVDFLNGAIDDCIAVEFVRLLFLLLCAGFFLLGLILFLFSFPFQNGPDFSEIKFLEFSSMRVSSA